MNIPHILHAVMCEPWCIMPSVHASIRRVLEAKFLASDPPQRPPGYDVCGNQVAVESMQYADGLAVIPIGGVMARGVPQFERGSGVVDVEDVMRDLDWAMASNDVSTVLLSIDSPGGMVSGTPELASKIASAAHLKGVYAYTSGTMASAAVWAGTKASAVFASPSSTVGSIGVYMPWVDSSAYLDKQGIKVDVISSGKFKGMGEPGTSLTQEQRDYLQERVNSIAADFQASVMESRQSFDSDLMDGRIFSGKEAVSNGLIDGNYDTLQEVINTLGFDSSKFTKRHEKSH